MYDVPINFEYPETLVGHEASDTLSEVDYEQWPIWAVINGG